MIVSIEVELTSCLTQKQDFFPKRFNWSRLKNGSSGSRLRPTKNRLRHRLKMAAPAPAPAPQHFNWKYANKSPEPPVPGIFGPDTWTPSTERRPAGNLHNENKIFYSGQCFPLRDEEISRVRLPSPSQAHASCSVTRPFSNYLAAIVSLVKYLYRR